MKLYIEREPFTWMDDYKYIDEDGNIRFSIESVRRAQMGHEHIIRDDRDWEIGRIKERVTTMKPYYEIILGGKVIGRVHSDRTFIKKELLYNISFQKWKVEGDIRTWRYQARFKGKDICSFGSVEKDGKRYFCLDIADDLPGDMELKAVMLACGIHLFNSSMNEDYLADHPEV